MTLEQIRELLEHASVAISVFAVGVVVVAFTLALFQYAIRLRKLEFSQNFNQFKNGLGRALALALEILIVADVIETITVEPTLISLGILSALVIARTGLSWALTLETEGYWPWNEPAEELEND